MNIENLKGLSLRINYRKGLIPSYYFKFFFIIKLMCNIFNIKLYTNNQFDKIYSDLQYLSKKDSLKTTTPLRYTIKIEYTAKSNSFVLAAKVNNNYDYYWKDDTDLIKRLYNEIYPNSISIKCPIFSFII